MGTKMLLTVQVFQMYTLQKETMRGRFSVKGHSGAHLLVWQGAMRGVLHSGSWSLRCCQEGATAWQEHRPLSTATFSCGNKRHYELQPGQNQRKEQSSGCATKVLVPSLSFLAFYQLKRVQPEIDIICKQISGIAIGAVLRVLAFTTTGHSLIIVACLGGIGYFCLEEARESLGVGCPTWRCAL